MKEIFRLFSYFLLIAFVNGCLDKPDKTEVPPVSTELPVISNLSRNIVFPKPGDLVVVSATVTAPESAPISSVMLQWTVNGVKASEVAMNKSGSGNVYSGTISGQFADGSAVAYTVSATNINGKKEEMGNYTVTDKVPDITNDYSQLSLNEINGNGEDSDRYIEIYNKSSDAVRLEGVKIYYSNLNSEPAISWTGAKDAIIHPKGFVLLKGTKETGNLSTGLSPTHGIIVELEDPDGNRLDFFKIDEDENRLNSYSRIPDGTGKWYLTYFAGTPGVTNGINFGSQPISTRPFITGFTRDNLVPTPYDQVNISATVIAFSGTTLSSVVIKWKVDGVAQSDMPTTNNKDVYMANITTKPAGSKVEYTLVATNHEGEKTEVSSRYFVFNDGDIAYHNLVINEIDGNSKFVELYNKGDVLIPLAGIYLVKNDQTFHWWKGSDDAFIEAKGYYTIAQTRTGNNINPNPPPNATEYTGVNGVSARQNLKFELWAPLGNNLLNSFIRTTNGGKLGDRIQPDYSAGPKYSFSRCPNGTGEFGLANPSCNASNPVTAAGKIEAY